MSVSYKGKSKEFIQKSAATFSYRAFAGRARAIDRAHIQGDEWYGWSLLEDELRATGDYIKSPSGILGLADEIMRCHPGRFSAYPLHLWKRRAIYRRLQWLRGQHTRLMINEPPFEGTANERQAEITKRKGQIKRYSDALDDLKPLHDEIQRQRRVHVQRKRRQRKRKAKRADEIKTALQHSRESLKRA